jgi:dihydroorotate dehydrogenase
MDPYRAVVRPLLHSLPPEFAHRLAGTLLDLPLPWRRIGGVPQDPRLSVELAGIRVRNPVGVAAGFDKACRHLDALGRLGFGYTVGGTVTRSPRTGNARPRIVRYPSRASMVNAMGLPNPGARAVAATLREHTGGGNPRGDRPPAPRFVSIADEAVEDVLAVHAALAPLADGIELNVSCPNVSWGRDRDNEAHLAELLRALGARGSKPLFVKLPPFRTGVELEVVLTLARIAQEGGADGLTCSNTRPVRDRRLAGGGGGVSGRALFVDTPRIVAEVRKATGGELPIQACGGIATAADAIRCLEAGASTVQVFTGFVYEGPRVVRQIVEGLLAALDERRSDLAGLASS